jgi:hypothetical protein
MSAQQYLFVTNFHNIGVGIIRRITSRLGRIIRFKILIIYISICLIIVGSLSCSLALSSGGAGVAGLCSVPEI